MNATQTLVLLLVALGSQTDASRTRKLVQKLEKTASSKLKKTASLQGVEPNSTKAGGNEKSSQVCMRKMFEMMQDPEQQKNAAKCEKDGKFVDQVIADLQKDDEASAKAGVEKLFAKCGPQDCASTVAPQIIQMLRFSGAGVSSKCQGEIKKSQSEDKFITDARMCDEKNKISEQALAALDAGNITTAQGFAQQALETCQNISKACAHAAAPAVLNTAMMRAQEEEAMETMLNSAPVMIIQPVIMVEANGVQDSNGHKRDLSLLNMAASGHKKQFRRAQIRGAKTTALLQVGSHHGPWISELLVQLALRK